MISECEHGPKCPGCLTLTILVRAEKAEARIDAALAICDEWDRLTKGTTPTTERIRGALTK